MGRKTKIVCTIGTATESEESIHQLIANGMDVCRLNMSHGTHGWHAEIIKLVRKLSPEVSIMMDIQGAKIRTSQQIESITLQPDDNLTIHTGLYAENNHNIGISYLNFDKEVSIGQTILIDDGRIHLVITQVNNGSVDTKVVVGGILTDRRGVSVPSANFSMPTITEKDKKDLLFGIEHGVDCVAVSFVRAASDIIEVKNILYNNNTNIPVISKIEAKQGLTNFTEILQVSDGIMVARGDLGVEIPIEEVPIAQKLIVAESNASNIPVIVATQMLESMINDIIPTRAETTDITNAILDGADAIMLSGETAAGKYPIESIKMMDKIARIAESNEWKLKLQKWR